jgi:hypothetical protein
MNELKEYEYIIRKLQGHRKRYDMQLNLLTFFNSFTSSSFPTVQLKKTLLFFHSTQYLTKHEN